MHSLTWDELPLPPRRLGRRAALRVVVHRLRSAVLFLVGSIFLVVGLVFAAAFIPLAFRDRALLRNGVPAVATVVGKSSYTRSNSRGNSYRVYELEYEFPVANGRTWAGAQDVGRDTWNRLREGNCVNLRYDAGNPDRHLLPGVREDVMPIFATLFPLVFIVLGGVLLRFGIREVTVPLRLYRDGEATTARVERLEVVQNERVNGRHPMRICYSFRDALGNEREGATKTLDDELIEALEEGAAVTILYDARDPERNVLFAALGISPGETAGSARGAGDSTVVWERSRDRSTRRQEDRDA